jgi:hypothetical protein
MPISRFGLLLALLLGGCATRITSVQRIGLDQFVGKSREYLLAELGTPSSTQAAQTRQGRDVANLTFVSQSSELVRPDLNFVFSGTNEPDTAWVDRRRCAMTFHVVGDTVAAWSLAGNACEGSPLPHKGSQVAWARDRLAAESSALSTAPAADVSGTFVEKGSFYSQ